MSHSCLLSLGDNNTQIIFGSSSSFGRPTGSSLADIAVPPLVRVEASIGVGLNGNYMRALPRHPATVVKWLTMMVVSLELTHNRRR